MPFQNVQTVSLAVDTSAAIAAKRFVAASAAGIVQAGAGANAAGVAMEAFSNTDFANGEASSVIAVATNEGCIVEVEAGAAVAAGANVAANANGAAIVATAGNVIMGQALDAAGAAGEVISILLSKAGATA